MSQQEIRLAKPDDRPRIEAIVEAAYSPYIAHMGRPPGPMLDDYAARIAAGQTHVLESADALVGILVLEPAEDHLLLDNVAVDPGAQGGGYGKALMAFAEAEARRQGYDRIQLYTHVLMVENVAIYERLGYRVTERKTVAGYDRVYMEKPV
ncbi:GNAT family N-acetyltransferase [Pelagibius sp.]|uniref:GNAT family N-acetyltransferase n=1 Tax=Pelagibius sp. TaxID=1931238 RepID=UPI0026318A82|nr:GNAT family N-acetyltransferase [Pelagibius sp.]